jgi:hypothetical protein
MLCCLRILAHALSIMDSLQAIAVDGDNHVLWSNRSASKASLKDFSGALEDAEKVCSTVIDRGCHCR